MHAHFLESRQRIGLVPVSLFATMTEDGFICQNSCFWWVIAPNFLPCIDKDAAKDALSINTGPLLEIAGGKSFVSGCSPKMIIEQWQHEDTVKVGRSLCAASPTPGCLEVQMQQWLT